MDDDGSGTGDVVVGMVVVDGRAGCPVSGVVCLGVMDVRAAAALGVILLVVSVVVIIIIIYASVILIDVPLVSNLINKRL